MAGGQYAQKDGDRRHGNGLEPEIARQRPIDPHACLNGIESAVIIDGKDERERQDEKEQKRAAEELWPIAPQQSAEKDGIEIGMQGIRRGLSNSHILSPPFR
jgi:hypothetical protein